MPLFIVLLACVAFVSQGPAEAPAPKDKRKHMDLGKYAASGESYRMWNADPAI